MVSVDVTASGKYVAFAGRIELRPVGKPRVRGHRIVCERLSEQRKVRLAGSDEPEQPTPARFSLSPGSYDVYLDGKPEPYAQVVVAPEASP